MAVTSLGHPRGQGELKGAGRPLDRQRPPTPKLLDGKQEAPLIALRLGPPPAGHAQWSLRLLAEQAVLLEIAPALSHETARRTLKKTGWRPARSPIG